MTAAADRSISIALSSPVDIQSPEVYFEVMTVTPLLDTATFGVATTRCPCLPPAVSVRLRCGCMSQAMPRLSCFRIPAYRYTSTFCLDPRLGRIGVI